MGLDMYLTKKTYIGANYKHRGVSGKIDITIKDSITERLHPVNINLNRVSSISEHVGYWCKANQIHRWFVENVQDGEDDCREYEVSHQDFQNLLEAVNTVMASEGTPEESSVIQENLPPSSEFLFGPICHIGSTEVDRLYWENLETTKKIVSNILAEMDEDSKNPADVWVEYYYSSSW
jgi:hypothetical protein